MRYSNLAMAAVVALVMMTVLTVPAREANAGLDAQQSCRADIDRLSSRYLVGLLRVRQRCLKKVFRGRLPLATDCIEADGDDATQARLATLRDRLGAGLGSRCAGVNYTALGYPGRCRDTNPPASTFDVLDIESCIIDEHGRTVAHLLNMEFPPEQSLPGRFVRCVAGVGGKAADMVRLEVRARHRCLFESETNSVTDLLCREPMPPYGGGTGDSVTNKRVIRGYAGLLSGTPGACRGIDVDFLGYTDDCVDTTGGRFNSFDLKLCLFEDHRATALDAIEVAYPAEPVCGDGDAEGDEECDDGNDNNEDDCLNSCTVARCGDGAVHAGVEQCDDGNSTETDACKNDCTDNVCGDTIINAGVEECDDGNSSDNDACLNTCENAVCGDGVTCLAGDCTSGPNGSFEDCDDGNGVSGDGCSSTCGIESCGDGIINNNNEECDDGQSNGNGPNQCRVVTCKLPSCGDGVVDDDPTFGEQCEPPGTNTCGDDCRFLLCGNGVVDVGAGEQCDDGAANSNTTPNACREDCTEPFCGDGKIDDQFGEQCDPVDAVDCLTGCVLPNCGNGTLEPEFGEECDNGAANSDTTPDACRENCKNPACGDTVVDSSEACDDGNGVDTDACKNDCSDNVCGDGVVYTGIEQCDDGNGVDTDACKNDCSDNVCGDGVVFGGVEDCDNGAANSDTQPDACRTTCVLPSCGDGVIDPGLSEQCDDGQANSDTAADACRSDCSNPICGDGVADTGEECDGTDASVCLAQGSTCDSTCACLNECPAIGEAILFAGGGVECVDDSVCGPGTCVAGRCRTVTNLDTGWTGIGHNSDVTDRIVVRAFLECGATFPCGECTIAGIDPSPGYCRCANDNQTICMKPFQADNDSCGGAECNCYLGPPLSLSAGSTPVCVVNRIRNDLVGTGNVDLGEGAVRADLASIVFTGDNLFQPCPSCVGDTTPNDGLKEGTCDIGDNQGQPCDGNGLNGTFPAPGGGQHSIDCFPSAGKNVSGTGLRIGFDQSTSRSVLGPPAVACDLLPPLVTDNCLCGICTGDPTFTTPCSSDAECAAGVGGTCSTTVGPASIPRRHDCGASGCVDVDGNGLVGECPNKTEMFCDGFLKTNGAPFIGCLADGDCLATTIGFDAGKCTIVVNRPCFLDVVVADGVADPSAPVTAATFCIPPTINSGINDAAGLPGPGRVVTQTAVRTFCKSDPSVEYIPGVGGCN